MALKIKLAIIFIIGFTLSSCASKKKVDKYPDMPISQEDMTVKAYEVLGDLNVTARKSTIFDHDPTKEDVNRLLKIEAKKLGADAVILVRYGTIGIGWTSWGELEGNGRAIKILD